MGAINVGGDDRIVLARFLLRVWPSNNDCGHFELGVANVFLSTSRVFVWTSRARLPPGLLYLQRRDIQPGNASPSISGETNRYDLEPSAARKSADHRTNSRQHPHYDRTLWVCANPALAR